MSEASLWTYLRDKLLPAGIHATRIENGVSSGFPDVHYTYISPNDVLVISGRRMGQATSGTMELKFLRKKKPPFGDDGLNRDQRWWIRDELAAGGKVWIVAEINKKIYFVPGKCWEEFNEFSLSDFESYSSLVITKRKVAEEDRMFLATNIL